MLLLDTCTLLWLVADKKALSPRARELIADPKQRLFVSAISAFEIGVKHGRRALTLPLPPDVWYQQALEFHGVEEVPVTGRIAAQATLLPRLHTDPCDRIIVATAQLNGIMVLTPDAHIRRYPDVETAW